MTKITTSDFSTYPVKDLGNKETVKNKDKDQHKCPDDKNNNSKCWTGEKVEGKTKFEKQEFNTEFKMPEKNNTDKGKEVNTEMQGKLEGAIKNNRAQKLVDNFLGAKTLEAGNMFKEALLSALNDGSVSLEDVEKHLRNQLEQGSPMEGRLREFLNIVQSLKNDSNTDKLKDTNQKVKDSSSKAEEKLKDISKSTESDSVSKGEGAVKNTPAQRFVDSFLYAKTPEALNMFKNALTTQTWDSNMSLKDVEKYINTQLAQGNPMEGRLREFLDIVQQYQNRTMVK